MSIKGCPQPDPPELVMRADGYHYRTEDEMKDKTVGSMPTETSLMLAAQAWCEPETSSIVMNVPLATAFARILDRALNATADMEHQSVGKPVAWLLTDKKINDIQVDSVQRLIDRARQAHFTDLIIRINGKDEHYQADWLKHLVRAEAPVCAPADRDVMRQAPNGWKLVPIEPTLDQYNSACRAYSDWQVQCQEEAREHEDERNPSWGYSQPHFTHSDVYRAMLAAVPTPPAEQQETALPPLTCGRSKRSDCALYEPNRPSKEWYAQKIKETEGLDDALPSGALVKQQVAQEPVAWMTPGGDVTRSKVFADEQSALSFGQQRPTPLYTQPSPSLAELRAKVEALPTYGNEWTQGYRDAVLAEIDKAGGKL